VLDGAPSFRGAPSDRLKTSITPASNRLGSRWQRGKRNTLLSADAEDDINFPSLRDPEPSARYKSNIQSREAPRGEPTARLSDVR